MKITWITAIALVAALVSAPAFAGSCPLLMKDIDARIASNPDIPQNQLTKAKGLRDKGEAMHKAGKHGESVEALNEAKKLLGM